MPDGSIKIGFIWFDLGKVGNISALSARREHYGLESKSTGAGIRSHGTKGRNVQGCSPLVHERHCPTLVDLTCGSAQATCMHTYSHGSGVTHSWPSTPELFSLSRPNFSANSRERAFLTSSERSSRLDHAKQCAIRVPDISLASIKLTSEREATEAVYFKRNDAQRIIHEAR